MAGTVLVERYALEDRIGVGGMASVYRAIDLTTGKRVAVKVLNRELLAKNPKEADRHIKRFRREGEILRLLAGEEYIVQFIEQGASPAGDQFIAMELLEGEQLRFYIGRGKAAMGLRTFAYYAKHLIKGLIGIHARNLIHRDLAPDNIVIVKTPEGLPWPKFLDFGIGKSLEGELDQVTQMLTIMGKPQYFSPEQARGQDLTSKSDIYALGVVLYEMATGSVPLEIHGMADLRRVQKEPPPPITSYREGCRLPEDLQAIIMQCLEKEPDDRPSLEAVLAEVEKFSDRLDAGEEFPMPATATGHSPSRASAISSTTPPSGEPEAPRRVTGEFGEGDAIGRFQVRERIGRGGMGLVYLAWDPILLRDVAIKVATRVEGEKARRAILREARASSHLKSENIVTIYDAGIEAGAPYIAMEYVPGRTLAQITEAEGPLRGQRFFSLARGILDGLIYAHEGESPVIHRDLKPANILCTGDVAKITDFGIATVTAAQRLSMSAHDATTGGTSGAGSVYTISPEQANNKPADHRSDIYALGCILYMMVTGRPPFEGNQIAVLYQHVTKPPPPPMKLNPGVTPELNALILKCLEKEPANRYQTVRQVKEALDDLVGAARAAHSLHRSPVVLASLAAIAIAGIAIAYALYNRSEPGGSKAFEVRQITTNVPMTGELLLEVVSGVAGEIKVTIEGGGSLPKVESFSIPAGVPTQIKPRLPKGQAELTQFKVTVERPDRPEQPPEKYDVVLDNQKPRIRFSVYGETIEPRAAPIPVFRLKDVKVEIVDDGGLDPESERTQGSVSFTRSNESGSITEVTGTVDAKDRAGNSESVSQTFQVLPTSEIEVHVVTPVEGSTTTRKTLDVVMVARLANPKLQIPGRLDAKDLELGTDAFTARIAVPQRPQLQRVSMIRAESGGYSATLALPDDIPEDSDFNIEFEFERDPLRQTHYRFDRVPPVITAQSGLGAFSSAKSYDQLPVLYEDLLEPQGNEVTCRIDDGPAGVEGATVQVTIGDGAPQTVPIGRDGVFKLPATERQDFTVRIEGKDQAGNEAHLGFRVVRKGVLVTSVRVSGAAPDSENRIFVKDDKVPVRITAANVSEEDSPFVTLLDESDREVDTAKLDLAPGEEQVFEARELRLSPEGAGFVKRKLRVMLGKPGTAAQLFSKDLVIVYDREPPAVSVVFEDGDGEEIREGENRTAGRFPPLKVKFTDNVALASTDPADLLSWTREDRSAPNVVVTLSSTPTPSEFGSNAVTFTIKPPDDDQPDGQPPDEPAQNRFDFKIHPKDLAGREIARAFSITIVPSEVSIISIAGAPDFSRFAEPSTALILNRDSIPVVLRAPLVSAGPCKLIAKVYPKSAKSGPPTVKDVPLTVKEFPLESEEGSRQVDLVIPLPKPAGGRLIDDGRVVLFLQESGHSRPEELATVYYLLDREPPSWKITRNARPIEEMERNDWIEVASLQNVRIEVTDGQGAGFGPKPIEDPLPAFMSPIESSRTADRIAFTLKDDDVFLQADVREIEIRVSDVVGNMTPIKLKFRRSKELLTVSQLRTEDGRKPIEKNQNQNQVLVVKSPALTFVIDNDAVGFDGVKWVVKRADLAISEGFVSLKERQTAGPELIKWEAAENAEPYAIDFYASRASGLEAEAFHRIRVLVDEKPPSIHLYVGERPIITERVKIKDFGDLRLRIIDAGAGLGTDPPTAEIVAGGVRTQALLEPSRDGLLRIDPQKPLEDGIYSIEITARDRYANIDTKPFEVELDSSAPASRPSKPVASRPTTNPASERTIANQAIRQKDEERTGIRFAPVFETQDTTATPRFFMSQTEVTNEQFLRFVDALLKDQIPPELRWRPDLTLTKKRVEGMRSRFDDFRRDPALPLVEVDSEIAAAFAAWAGGRLPSKDEWAKAAGRYLVKDAVYPVYMDRGSPKSSEFFMREPTFANFQRGSREAKRLPVTELLRYQANAPFGIVGFAGNVAEWVTAEPGARKVAGTMGGSFKYSYTNDVNTPRLDREPRPSASDAGIRVLWPAQVKAP